MRTALLLIFAAWVIASGLMVQIVLAHSMDCITSTVRANHERFGENQSWTDKDGVHYEVTFS